MTPADSRLCPSCGNQVDADSRFCKHCAFDLSRHSKATIVSAESQQKPKSKRILIFTALGVATVLVLGVIGGFLYKRHRAQARSANTAPTPSGPIVGERAGQIENRILRGETLTESDLTGLTPYELRVLRNVHFARYGRKYDQNGDLGSYFHTRPWYKPNDSSNDNMINATDKANVALILNLEKTGTNANNPNSTVVNTEPASTPHPSNELTRESILALLSNRRQPVTMTFERHNEFRGSANNSVYERLISDGIVKCQKTYRLKTGNVVNTNIYNYTECTPGPNGREFRISSNYLMEAIIGYKVPSQVTGISRIDASSAIADVLVTFERSSGYRLYERYQFIFGAYARSVQNESRRVLLRLYDDGWRVERFN